MKTECSTIKGKFFVSYMFLVYIMPNKKGCPRGVMAQAIDCEIVVSEFEFHSRYYAHLWVSYEPPYPPCFGLNSTSTVLLERWLWH